MAQASPTPSSVPETFKAAVNAMVESTCSVYSEADAARAHAFFEKHGGSIDRSQLSQALLSMFENQSHEQPQILVHCPLLLDRIFAHMEQAGGKKVEFNTFMATVGLLFSGYKDEQVKIHLAFYDPKNTGQVQKEEVLKFVNKFLDSVIEVRAKKYAGDELKFFNQVKSQAEGAVGRTVLRALVDRGFQTSGGPCSTLPHAKFTTAYRANPTFFHFQHLACDVLELIAEDMRSQ